MIRILIADDHSIVREGLKQIVLDTTDLVVSGEAGTGKELMELIRNKAGDVVLLDINMPGRGGLDILKEIKEYNSRIPVLMLSMYSEDRYAIRVLRIGASGYMTKESAPDKLIEAIRIIASGRKYVSSSLAEKLAVDLGVDRETPPHETLSDREYQIFNQIVHGKTVTQISDDLCLSSKTISTYRTRILEKMRFENNAQLMYYAFKNNLVD